MPRTKWTDSQRTALISPGDMAEREAPTDEAGRKEVEWKRPATLDPKSDKAPAEGTEARILHPYPNALRGENKLRWRKGVLEFDAAGCHFRDGDFRGEVSVAQVQVKR